MRSYSCPDRCLTDPLLHTVPHSHSNALCALRSPWRLARLARHRPAPGLRPPLHIRHLTRTTTSTASTVNSVQGNPPYVLLSIWPSVTNPVPPLVGE